MLHHFTITMPITLPAVSGWPGSLWKPQTWRNWPGWLNVNENFCPTVRLPECHAFGPYL